MGWTAWPGVSPPSPSRPTGVIAYLQGQIYLDAFCFTVVGAIMAFLWYNAYPADLFMGDAVSLALGATLAWWR